MGQCVTKPLADGDPAFDVPGPRSGARSGARGGAAARALARSNTTTSDRTAGSTPRFAPRRPSLPRKSSGNATLSAAVSRRLSGGSACSEYGDEEEEAAERVAAMRHLSTLLPRRGSDAAVAAAAAARRKAMPPTAPSKLAAALAAAVTAGDANWATGSEVVAEVLADDVQYIDLRGEVANGKQAALESMDAGMGRLLQRIRRSTRSGRTDHLKLKSDGPRAAGKGVWVTLHTFRLYLLSVRVQEEYTVDDGGKIVKLVRTMVNQAQAKQLLEQPK